MTSKFFHRHFCRVVCRLRADFRDLIDNIVPGSTSLVKKVEINFGHEHFLNT